MSADAWARLTATLGSLAAAGYPPELLEGLFRDVVEAVDAGDRDAPDRALVLLELYRPTAYARRH